MQDGDPAVNHRHPEALAIPPYFQAMSPLTGGGRILVSGGGDRPIRRDVGDVRVAPDPRGCRLL